MPATGRAARPEPFDARAGPPDADAERSAWLDDGDPAADPSSAWATGEPMARTAPTPSVTAPNPSRA